MMPFRIVSEFSVARFLQRRYTRDLDHAVELFEREHIAKNTHVADKEPCEKRTDSGHCYGPCGEVGDLERGGGESPHASPDADLADVAICMSGTKLWRREGDVTWGAC